MVQSSVGSKVVWFMLTLEETKLVRGKISACRSATNGLVVVHTFIVKHRGANTKIADS